jgi:peptide/nickel transport system substrate-binding protein
MRILNATRIVLIAAALAASAGNAFSQKQKVLKAVIDGEIQVTDPIATTSYVTRTFAYLVFDTLIAMNSKGEYKPQMLESFEVSKDRMSYTFKLRKGLEFHDGAPVTAADCVASIRRWAARDGLGKLMMNATKTIIEVDKSTFRLELARPFGFVIEALGKPSSNVPVIMPVRLASLDPSKPVPEVMGSGPFIFRKESWVPGSRMVLDRNPKYVPRNEPADGFSGGKRVFVDRVELVSIPDAATKASALRTGEVDYVQNLPFDFVPTLAKDKNITLDQGAGLANYVLAARPNHAQPPFNNPKIRQALQALMTQKDMLAALGAPPKYSEECYSVFMCGGPFSNDSGTENLKNASVEKARALLKEAGYKGEKVVVIHSSDIQTIHLFSTVLEELMKKAGFNVEVQASDWATVAKKRWNREPVEKGGWSLMPLQWAGYDLETPLTHYGIAYNCTNGYAGWSCDEDMGRLLTSFAEIGDPSKRRAYVEQIQRRAHENVSIVLGGQFTQVYAFRSNLKGVISVGIPLFWNIQKQ